MNRYKVTVYDYNIRERFEYHLTASGSEEAGRLADEDCRVNQVVEKIELKERGVVPFDLSSGTSQC